MSQQQPPKIEFPCPNYPIKVLGENAPELHELVVTVMERHVEDFDQLSIQVRESSKGRWQSLTVTITATGKPQLQAIFDDLKDHPLVKMVL